MPPLGLIRLMQMLMSLPGRPPHQVLQKLVSSKPITLTPASAIRRCCHKLYPFRISPLQRAHLAAQAMERAPRTMSASLTSDRALRKDAPKVAAFPMFPEVSLYFPMFPYIFPYISLCFLRFPYMSLGFPMCPDVSLFHCWHLEERLGGIDSAPLAHPWDLSTRGSC